MTRKKKLKPKDVPVIMQMEFLECGAASLSMILAYYGRWISLEQLREDCGVSRDGSLASNMAKAAMKHGLKVSAHRYNIESIKTKTIFPAIIHWNFNHFVVLIGFTDKYALINDPARGFVKVPMDEFNKSFTGVVLEFEPTEHFKKEGKPESVLKFVWEKLKGSKFLVMTAILLAGLATIGSILTPALSRFFTDEVLGDTTKQYTYPLVGAIIILFLFQLIVGLVYDVYRYRVLGKLSVISSSEFIWHILHMPMKFFSQRSPGDLSNRQGLNDSIAQTLLTSVVPLFINILLLGIYLFVMIRYSVLLSIIGVATVLLNAFVARLISKLRVDTTRVRMKEEAKLNSMTVSGIEMIETIKATGIENNYFEKWAGSLANSELADVKEEQATRYLIILPELIQTICDISILITGVYLIMQGSFTAGTLVAFQALLSQFVQPVSQLIESGQSIQEMRTSMERVNDVLKYEEDDRNAIELSEEEDYNKLTGDIELENVTFGYSPLSPPLLKNFNLKINPGDKIAIVGMSGCGKSTIAKLIAGLYKPWSGTIKFDGKEIEEIPQEVFNGSVQVVDQDIIMFEDSISDNIKMWDENIEDFEVIMASMDAQIHDIILERTGGYNYVMADGGTDFSGGQRQRLEIARVLANDPTIAILDEATSALDAKTEYDVIQGIQDRGITTIIIAHRLSTIRDADLILVMDKGEVREIGTHDELYRKEDGLYRRLVTTE